MAHTGHCLCGAVRFTGKGKPSAAHVCHCRDCGRWAGGPFIGVEFEDGFEVAGEVRWYRSSGWAERGSCPACGSAMFYRLQTGGFMNVGIGFLDDPDAIAPVDREIYIDRKPGAYALEGQHKRLTAEEFLATLQGGA